MEILKLITLLFCYLASLCILCTEGQPSYIIPYFLFIPPNRPIEWSQHGPAFALKLLQELCTNDSTNRAFSPLALKLNLLTLSPLLTDESQSNQIAHFIFSDQMVTPWNISSQYLQEKENILSRGLLASLNTTQNPIDIANRTEFYFLNNRGNDKSKLKDFFMYPGCYLKSILSYNYYTNYEKCKRKVLSAEYIKNKAQYLKANPDEFDSTSPNEAMHSHARELCLAFDDYAIESSLEPCLHYLNVFYWEKEEDEEEGRLSRSEKVQLCHQFQVQKYSRCLAVFLQSAQESQNATLINRETLLWQLVREFPKTKNMEPQFQQILLNYNNNKDRLISDEWAKWSKLMQFDLPNRTELIQWKRFKRENVSNSLQSLLPPVLSNHTKNPLEIFTTIQLDLQWKHEFIIRKRLFFGPNKTAYYDVPMWFGNQMIGFLKHRNRSKCSWTMVQVAYSNPSYSFVIMMPGQRSNISEMLHCMTPSLLNDQLAKVHVNLRNSLIAFPNFSVEEKITDLGEILAKNALNGTNVLEFGSNWNKTKISVKNAFQQVIRMQTVPKSPIKNEDIVRQDLVVKIDRPFVYLVVGKYIDLHNSKPGFEILLSGYYYEPASIYRHPPTYSN